MFELIFEFVLKYWLTALFGGVTAFMAWGYKKIAAEVKARQAEMDLLKKANIALLHNELYRIGNELLGKDEITVSELENFDMIYEAYSGLGGNGTGSDMHDAVHEKWRK